MRMSHFEPYQLSEDEISNPECCQTIDDVIEAVKTFKKNFPKEAKQLNLPEC